MTPREKLVARRQKRFTWTREGSSQTRYRGEWFRALDARHCGGGRECPSKAANIPQGTPYAKLDIPGTEHQVTRGVIIRDQRSYCPACTAKIAPHAACPFPTQKPLTQAQKEMGARLYLAVLAINDDGDAGALYVNELREIANALFERYGANPAHLLTGAEIEAFVRQPRKKKRRNV